MNTGIIYYIHNDHLHTPQAMTNQNQQVVWMGNYESFGKVAANANNTIEIFSRFPGQYLDNETGLYYNYFRDYDPSVGRYIESDPIGLAGGINTYGYVSGNPLRYVYPYGLHEETLNPAGALFGIGLIAAALSGNEAAQDLFADLGDAISDMMAAQGNVADTQIVQAYGEAASAARQCGGEPPDRCKWLEQNKGNFRPDQVKRTEKAWGCRRSRQNR